MNKSFKILLLVALIFSISATTEAKISIQDNWDTSGELILENANWEWVFSKEEGALLIYSKLESDKSESMKIVPFYSEKVKAESIISCEVVRDDEKNTEIRVSFSIGGKQIKGDFLFSQNGTVHIKPLLNMKGISVFSPIEYGILPSRYLTDNIYDPSKYPAASRLYLPSENIFMGLLKGRNGILVCVWPAGNQKIKLLLENHEGKESLIQAVEIELDEKSIYLGILTAPGIWHRQELLPSYLGKDVVIDWNRPFPAKWRTQLLDIKSKMTFPFRKKRGDSGSVRKRYVHPVWFEGEKAFLHISKKTLPPSSDKILIYALEGNKNTSIEFVNDCLGNISVFKKFERIPDYPGLGINCCPGRDFLNKLFKEARPGIHIREREFFKEITVDFRHSFLVIKQRLEDYDNFILKMEEMIDFWSKKEKDKPELQTFFNDTKNQLKELKMVYHARMKGLTPSEIFQQHIVEVVEKLEEIFEDDGVEVVCPAVCSCLSKIELWGVHHYAGWEFGIQVNKWYQQAGYSCAENAAIVSYAEEIRRHIRELRIGIWSYEMIR